MRPARAPLPLAAALLALALAPLAGGLGCGDTPPKARAELPPGKLATEMQQTFAGALALAKEDRPALDQEDARRRVDEIGAKVGKEVRLTTTTEKAGEAIASVFWGGYDFGADPKDPDGKLLSSYDLGAVLERRRGACLAQAIVLARACAGAGLQAGVARAPGHAFVVIGTPGDRVYLDPAQRGRGLRWSDVGREHPWSPKAVEQYDGHPMPASETLALYRASRAAIRLDAKDQKGAEADARAALAAVPDLPEALVNLAAVLLVRKQGDDLDEAEDLLERARELLPKSVSVLYNSGLLAAAQGDRKAAIRYFDQVLSLEPAHPGAKANKDALERQGK